MLSALAIVVFCGYPASQAMAQSEETGSPGAAASDEVPAEPSITTQSFGDWVLRCEQPQPTAQRVCEVALTIQVQGQNAPVAQIAVGRLADNEPLRVTTLLPPSVSFPSTVEITAAPESEPLELDWIRCLPNGCFADAALTEEQIDQWRAAVNPGRLSFTDASGREIGIPVSYRGITQALNKLNNQD